MSAGGMSIPGPFPEGAIRPILDTFVTAAALSEATPAGPAPLPCWQEGGPSLWSEGW